MPREANPLMHYAQMIAQQADWLDDQATGRVHNFYRALCAAKNKDVDTEQMDALTRICSFGGGLTIINGIAGGGKGNIALTLASTVQHVTAIGCNKASTDRLRKEFAKTLGENSILCAVYDNHHCTALEQGETDLVVVDEAAMLTEPEFLYILGLCARHHYPLMLVGDFRQLPASDNTHCFAALVDAFPERTITLATTQRQKKPGDNKATQYLFCGAMDAALQHYAPRMETVDTIEATAKVQTILGEWMANPVAVETKNDCLVLARDDVQLKTIQTGQAGIYTAGQQRCQYLTLRQAQGLVATRVIVLAKPDFSDAEWYVSLSRHRHDVWVLKLS